MFFFFLLFMQNLVCHVLIYVTTNGNKLYSYFYGELTDGPITGLYTFNFFNFFKLEIEHSIAF